MTIKKIPFNPYDKNWFRVHQCKWGFISPNNEFVKYYALSMDVSC